MDDVELLIPGDDKPSSLISEMRRLVGRAAERFIAPIVPNDYQLAFSFRVAQLCGYGPELRFLDRLGPNCGVAVDAGANKGLFTARLASLYNEVHAFEIEPKLAARLEAIAPCNVTVHAVGLSSRVGSAVLHTPIRQGIRLDGWASLEQENCPGAERYVNSNVEVRPLDTFEIHGVTFLKVDVEGHEVEVLGGARQTILRDRPCVLLEVRQWNRTAVQAYFDEIGYCEWRLEEIFGGEWGENYVYVPCESTSAQCS